MAEYIEIEKIFPNRVFYVNEETPLTSLNALINHICNLPTADVVPKSEVDLYKRQVDELEDELATTYDKLEKAKAEVAKKIFGEIEENISPMLGLEDDKEYVAILATAFAELKKKYT